MKSLITTAQALALLTFAAGCSVLPPASVEAEPSNVSDPLQKAIALYEQGIEQRYGEKILDGTPATIAEVPWQAALVSSYISQADEGIFCGGSVIDAQWVLTAAHCVVGGYGNAMHPSLFHVVANTDDLTSVSQRVNVEKIYVHESYVSASTSGFDIALLKLKDPVTSENIALLDTNLDEMTGSGSPPSLLITGFGVTEMNGKTSPRLQKINVPYVPTSICNAYASYGGSITETMLCAGLRDGKKDACQGDSGGPAVLKKDGKNYLVGITSWGEGCGLPNKYGVYARVSALKAWVDSTIAEN